MQNNTNTLENCLAGTYKVKHIAVIWSRHSILRYLPKRNESAYPYKDLYASFHISFIYNGIKMDTTQMPLKRQMDKQTGISKQQNSIQQ